ncbi:MAG TPA: hypothetical protein VMV73_03495, partial [Candidatus Dormibacteraeota bacterium]|nr:hypothetical protein [Candidatus Dormibacteraeota bacterium]
MNVRATLAAAAIALAVTLVGCSHARAPQPAPSSGAALYDASALPHGKMGALIRDGYNIITQTHKYAKPYVVSQMECSSCHIAGGIVPRGGWLAVYGTFPQYSPRAKRAITLQDRIAECFLYSMNGKPPAYTSHTMIAMVAYMAW